MQKNEAINLRLFDEGAATGANGTPVSGQQATTEGNITGATVVYGKQHNDTAEAKASNPAAEEANSEITREERRKAYDAFIKGEGKEFYAEDTQNMINRRFKGVKSLEEERDAYKSAVEPLMVKYGVADVSKLSEAIKNDRDLWREKAEENGLTVEQYTELEGLRLERDRLKAAEQERERADFVDKQYSAWEKEADELKKTYADFDLRAELQNPQFRGFLRNGISLQNAYEVIHMNDIKAKAAADASKAVGENIKARGQRPTENGAASSPAVIVKNDPSQFTDEDMERIKKRVQNGERIVF